MTILKIDKLPTKEEYSKMVAISNTISSLTSRSIGVMPGEGLWIFTSDRHNWNVCDIHPKLLTGVIVLDYEEITEFGVVKYVH